MASMEIGVTMNLQDAYDNARAMAKAFTALADTLKETAKVCDHPVSLLSEDKVDGMRVCAGCERLVKR